MRSDFQYTEYGAFSTKLAHAILSDICVDNSGVQTGPFGSQLHKKDYVKSGTPIITVEHLGDNRIIHIDTPFVSDDDKNRLSKYHLKEGDIVFSRVGSVDRRALVRKEENGWLFSGRCLRVRVDKTKVSPVFLSYFLGFDGVMEYIRSIAVGATMPSINTKILSDLPIYYPFDLEEQKAIAHILGSLDDKIELNRQMNKTLEEMAQALFKSWFVDFDPVLDNALVTSNPIPEELSERAEVRKKVLADGTANREIAKQFPAKFQHTEEMGWIPDGWKISKANDLVTRIQVKKKFNKKNVFSLGEIPVFDQSNELILGYHSGEADINSSSETPKFIFGDHTCITHVSLAPFSVGPNVIPLEAKIFNSYWTYFAIKDLQKFQEYRRHWMEFKIKNVITPQEELAGFFGNCINKSFISIEKHNENSKLLERLRDTLLPKLISGELRIPDAEKLVEEAIE